MDILGGLLDARCTWGVGVGLKGTGSVWVALGIGGIGGGIGGVGGR